MVLEMVVFYGPYVFPPPKWRSVRYCLRYGAVWMLALCVQYVLVVVFPLLVCVMVGFFQVCPSFLVRSYHTHIFRPYVLRLSRPVAKSICRSSFLRGQ